jgi:DeoR/GlpR family transcriptional regulator of sugar metabolism
MSVKERELNILTFLKSCKQASVSELCRQFYVSEPTMRRSLSALASEGKIIRTHGGAAIKNEPGENIPLFLREREHSDAKAIIGKKCISLIPRGATVMTDGSSTAMALLNALDPGFGGVVITNSAKASLILAKTGIKAFVTGGELSSDTYAYTGGYAESFLRSFNADICFFSVRTLTSDGRLTDNAIDENSARKIMLAQSKCRVLMLDSKKLGNACLNTLCTLNDIDYVVSEDDISSAFPEHAKKFI